MKSCPGKFRYKIEGCGAQRHTLLHRLKIKPNEVVGTKKNENEKNDEVATSSHSATSRTSDAVLLQVAPVRVIGENRTVTTYAMLAILVWKLHLVDPSVIDHISAPGGRNKLSVSTVNNDNDLQDSYRVTLSIESIVDENLQRLTLSNVWSSRKLKS